MLFVIRSTFSVRPMFYTGNEKRWTTDPHDAAWYQSNQVDEAALRVAADFVRVDVLTLKFQTIYDAEAEANTFNNKMQAKVRISYRGFNHEFTREEFVAMLRDDGIGNKADIIQDLIRVADTVAERENIGN